MNWWTSRWCFFNFHHCQGCFSWWQWTHWARIHFAGELNFGFSFWMCAHWTVFLSGTTTEFWLDLPFLFFKLSTLQLQKKMELDIPNFSIKLIFLFCILIGNERNSDTNSSSVKKWTTLHCDWSPHFNEKKRNRELRHENLCESNTTQAHSRRIIIFFFSQVEFVVFYSNHIMQQSCHSIDKEQIYQTQISTITIASIAVVQRKLN